MANGKIATRAGMLVFDIEQNPEDPTMWGVWERLDSDPDSDEIVASFSNATAAQAWIDDKVQNWQQYLKDRGIEE